MLLVFGGICWLGFTCISGIATSYTEARAESRRRLSAHRKAQKQQRVELVQGMKDMVAKQSDEVVDAMELVRYYKANEVRADHEIKGKILCVSGTIRDIGRELMGGAYIAFEGPDDELGLVQCLFNEDEEQALVHATVGSKRTICGEGSGLMMNVLLRNCHLIGKER